MRGNGSSMKQNVEGRVCFAGDKMQLLCRKKPFAPMDIKYLTLNTTHCFVSIRSASAWAISRRRWSRGPETHWLGEILQGDDSPWPVAGRDTVIRMLWQQGPARWSISCRLHPALHGLNPVLSPWHPKLLHLHFAADFGGAPAGAVASRKLFTWAVSSQPR